eukprot:SAG31_NODE_14892_length_782_cov_0.590044_2_plen_154_part_00
MPPAVVVRRGGVLWRLAARQGVVARQEEPCWEERRRLRPRGPRGTPSWWPAANKLLCASEHQAAVGGAQRAGAAWSAGCPHPLENNYGTNHPTMAAGTAPVRTDASRLGPSRADPALLAANANRVCSSSGSANRAAMMSAFYFEVLNLAKIVH